MNDDVVRAADGLFALAVLMTLPVAMLSTLLFRLPVGIGIFLVGYLILVPALATLAGRGPFRDWLGMEEREPLSDDHEVTGLWPAGDEE